MTWLRSLLDLVDIADKEQPAGHPHAAADRAQQETIAQKDAPDPGGRGPQGLHDADITRLFDDDHREDRQDAEAGHGDDEEQEDVEDALLDGDGTQERALLLFPGVDAEERGLKLVERDLNLLGQSRRGRRRA